MRFLGFFLIGILVGGCQTVPKINGDIPTSIEVIALIEKHANIWVKTNKIPSSANEYKGYAELFKDLRKIGFFSSSLSYEAIAKQSAFRRTIEFGESQKAFLGITLDGVILRYEFEKSGQIYKLTKITEEKYISPSQSARKIIYESKAGISQNTIQQRLQYRNWYCDHSGPAVQAALERGYGSSGGRGPASVSDNYEKLFYELKTAGFFEESMVFGPEIFSSLVNLSQPDKAQLFVKTPEGPINFEMALEGGVWKVLRRHSCAY